MKKLLMCLTLGALVLGASAAEAPSRTTGGRPALRISPPVVEFGQSAPGVTKTRTVTITNTSGAPLTLSAGWSTSSTLDPGFGFPTGDACLQQEGEILEAGQSCTLTFTFSSAQVAAAEATFVFSLDGWQSTAGTVRLRARTG
jgi:hypothetical protein